MSIGLFFHKYGGGDASASIQNEVCTIQEPLYKATEKTADLRFSEMVRISCKPTTPDSNPFSLQRKKEDSLYGIR
ncbi:hypothetical protein AAC387_Pa03g4640 [Persea americana]